MSKLGKHPNTSIKSVVAYNSAMTKPLLDKIFFADKVGGANLFIDYGCADGALIEFLAKILPDCYFIGFDGDVDMIHAAARRFNCRPALSPEATEFTIGANARIRFLSDFDGLKFILGKTQEANTRVKTCLILSSVVHEMYAYKRNVVDEIWKQLWDLNADYIALRDMMVSDTASRPADPLVVARVRQMYEPEPLRAFESQWGSISENWALTHFFLKYQYVREWDRELRENYLPISVERLLGLIPPSYLPIFMEHYTLPFLREQVLQDFGVQLQERTHLKLILKKTNLPDYLKTLGNTERD